MKNTWQLQCPAEQNYQHYLYQQLAKIKQMKINQKAKSRMVTAIIYLLKQKEQIEKVKAQQNISTSFSEEQSNFTAYEHEIQDLQDRILQKRGIKFQINEEIQGVEEDLFQMQKTVETKRQYDDCLRKQIQTKMKNIQRCQRQQQKTNDTSYLDKSFKAVAGIFKGWLY